MTWRPKLGSCLPELERVWMTMEARLKLQLKRCRDLSCELAETDSILECVSSLLLFICPFCRPLLRFCGCSWRFSALIVFRTSLAFEPLRAVIEDDAPSATRELFAATVVQAEALLALIVRPLISDADRLMGLAKAASDNITVAGELSPLATVMHDSAIGFPGLGWGREFVVDLLEGRLSSFGGSVGAHDGCNCAEVLLRQGERIRSMARSTSMVGLMVKMIWISGW